MPLFLKREAWFGTETHSFSPIPAVFADRELMFFHQAINTLLVDFNTLPVIGISPTSPVAPEGIIGL